MKSFDDIKSKYNQADFDFDASPDVFEKYLILYKDTKISKLFDFNKLDLTGKRTKTNPVMRISAYLNDDEAIKIFNKRISFAISGDTIFNFNEKKIYRINTFLNSISTSLDLNYINKIKDICIIKNHSLQNLSLMIQTGGINNVKGTKYKNNKDIIGDRFDKLVYKLDKYFRTRNDEFSIFARPNGEYLKAFLDKVYSKTDSIYEFINDFYFINNKDLINEIIMCGEQEINDVKTLLNYMELAIKFWEERKKYIGDTEL